MLAFDAIFFGERVDNRILNFRKTGEEETMITNRREFIGAAATAALAETRIVKAATQPSRSLLAAYYFGNYHGDTRNEAIHGAKWTEWRLVEQARPRFPDHQQPKVPMHGYSDEADPNVFAGKIRLAAAAQLSAFIFDYYWYEDGPFLQRCIDEGYLRAENVDKLKFALMWANHDWFNLFPARLTGKPELLRSGAVSTAAFERMVDWVVEQYFRHPSYVLLDGKPYFSIYELFRFVTGIGGMDNARRALDAFRERAVKAGFPGLHLNAVAWGVQLLPGASSGDNLPGLLSDCGIDSVTSYVWVHHAKLDSFPVTAYDHVREQYEAYRSTAARKFGRPYFPNVSVGWDPSPRACQTDTFSQGAGYGFSPVISGNTPAAFEKALASARDFVGQDPLNPEGMITVNSWNEWTEGSYLEPDTRNGTAYLDAISRVFPGSRRSQGFR
jgi:hypothetical protein